MCIAIFKKAGVPLPDNFKEQCKQSHFSNRNGMGLGLWKNGEKRLFISKGFFDFDAFWTKFESLNVQTEDALLVHARISTHGEVNDLNCHPFVISKKMEECHMVEGYTNKPIMIHNGVFYKYGTDKESKFSDTFHFANKYLTLPGVRDVLKYFPEKFSQSSKDIIVIKGKTATEVSNDFGSQKVAILYPNGKILHFGTFIKNGEMMYSNTGYKTFVTNKGGVNYADDDDYWNNHRDICAYYNRVPETKKVTPTAVSSGKTGEIKLLKSGNNDSDAVLVKKILTYSSETANKYLLIAKHDLQSSVDLVSSIKSGTLLIPTFYNNITQQTTLSTTLDGKSALYPTQLLIMQTENLIPWEFNSDNILKKMNNIWANHIVMGCEKDSDKYVMLKKHGVYEKKALYSLLFGWKFRYFQNKLLRIDGIERSKKALLASNLSKSVYTLESCKNKLCKLTVPMSKLEEGMFAVRAFTIDENTPVYTPVMVHIMDLIVEKDEIEEKFLTSSLKETKKELVN